MLQKDYVIEAMRANGGYATFQQLNKLVDCSNWGTKTPAATIRRIVQKNDEFFRIQSGLWALKEYENEVNKKFKIQNKSEKSLNEFTHSYFQGIIAEIGNIRKLGTYVPAQDKNKLFLEKKLCEVATVHNMYDTVCFNERKMPCAFYEVEHTTDIKNSLNKFYELQDFRARFCIVASKERKRQFDDIISSSIYNSIRKIVEFIDYDALVIQYENESKIEQSRVI